MSTAGYVAVEYAANNFFVNLGTGELLVMLLGINIPALLLLLADERNSQRFKIGEKMKPPLSLLISSVAVLAIPLVMQFDIGLTWRENFTNINLHALLLVAILAPTISFLVILWMSRSLSENALDKVFMKFTRDLEDPKDRDNTVGATVRIFAGGLSFLGTLDARCSYNDTTYGELINSNELCANYRKCKNRKCSMKKPQFRQIFRLCKEKNVKWKIFCKEIEDDNILVSLGKLIYSFGDKVEIRFYEPSLRDNVYIFSRTKIKPQARDEQICWIWKVSSDRYSQPKKYYFTSNPKDKDPMGDTLDYLANNLLWDKYKDKTGENGKTQDELREKCLNAFINKFSS